MIVITRCSKYVVATVASCFTVACVLLAGMRPAAAATGSQQQVFTYTSPANETVSCTIQTAYDSTPQGPGRWLLNAYVRIGAGSSPDCLDGFAHLQTVHADGQTDDFIGGGSSVQVSTTTATEVTSVAFELYFDGCACYTPLYHAPK
jgi:hypothetical protein